MRAGISKSGRGGALLVCIAGIAAYLALYRLRAIDDNRLASWDWLMGAGDLWLLLAVAAIGMAAALVLGSRRLPSPSVLAGLTFGLSALLWHTPETIVDAARYFTQAKHLELYGALAFLRDWGGPALEAWTDLPIIPFLYGVLFKLFGEHRLLAEILNSAFFSGTVWLVAATGRKLWDEELGRAAGLMLMAMPLVWAQAPLMLVDMGSMFFLTLAAYLFIVAIERGGAWRILYAGTAIAASALSKFSIWPMLSMLGVILLAYAFKRGRPQAMRGLSAAAAGFALLALSLWPMRDVVASQIAFLREYQEPGLRRWGETFTSTFLFQIHPFVTLAALSSLAVAIKRRDARYLIALWLPLLGAVFQIKRSRYLMPALPSFALMAAYGLSALGGRRAGRTAAMGAALASIAVVLAFYAPFLDRYDTVNLRDAAAFIDAMPGGAVEVVTLPQTESDINPAVSVPLLDLYLKKPIHYAYDVKRTVPDDVLATSALRFTWRYQNPAYYASPGASIYAVISDGLSPIPQPPDGFKLEREFSVSTGEFYYRPFVWVYSR